MDVGDWGEIAAVPESRSSIWCGVTIADANRMGITSVFVPGGNQGQQIARWAKVQDEGGLTLRANLGFSADFVHETPRSGRAQEADRCARRRPEVRQGPDLGDKRQGLLRRSDGVSGADGSDARSRTTSTPAAPTSRSGGRERRVVPIRPARTQGRDSSSSTRPAGRSTSTRSATVQRARLSTISRPRATRMARGTCATRSLICRRSTRRTLPASRVWA